MSIDRAYFGELRTHWRPLAAASIGVGTGLQLFSYTTALFAPFLVKQFGWSRAQFALIGLAMFAALFALPVVGSLTDRFGVRRMALAGALLVPLVFLSYSLQQGSFAVFFAISTAMLVFGTMTSPVVYTRLVAERFERARGLAFTIVTCAPAVVAAGIVPLLTMAIEAWGWRTGYRLMACWALLGGLMAVALAPPGAPVRSPVETPAVPAHATGAVLKSPVFWIIVAGMILCTLPTALHASQMNLMLMDQGLTALQAAAIVPIYAVGTVIGRITCGVALDRLPTPLVACLSMALPALGFALLASPFDAHAAVAMAMLTVGIAVGAEGDLSSFLVARYFPLEIYSRVSSLITCGIFFASASGSLLLSGLLKRFDSFAPFLWTVAGSVFLGGLLFLLLPGGIARAVRQPLPEPAPGA